MLHRAAAAGTRADAEIGAAGRHAQHAFLMDFRNAADVEARLRAQPLVGNAFSGKRPLDEDHLAVHVRNAAPFLIKALDVDGEVFGSALLRFRSAAHFGLFWIIWYLEIRGDREIG